MSGRLLAWLGIVAVQVAIGYADRATHGKPDRNVVYQWSTFGNVLVLYAVLFGVVLAISREQTPALLALRPPRSWARAAALAAAIVVAVVALEQALEPVLHASREQGLTPKHWEPAHAGAFAANFVVIALVGPFVEEALYRGLGYSLLARYGQLLAIVSTGVLFGLAHGLVEALPVLVALGIGLAYLRAKSGSIYPGFAVHAVFNGAALILAVTT